MGPNNNLANPNYGKSGVGTAQTNVSQTFRALIAQITANSKHHLASGLGAHSLEEEGAWEWTPVPLDCSIYGFHVMARGKATGSCQRWQDQQGALPRS